MSDSELKKEIKKEIEEFYEENERTKNMVLFHRQILKAAKEYGEDIALVSSYIIFLFILQKQLLV